ncbi:haloacid dehalogenase-like hydrolase [Lapidilactobacillus achengensis]|uniref:Haloacid dehalogenase-like hydrolase n=1 Tax=Lapidilactobacillus achengensis TaxID=2486000 RepID=A0ABW1UN81_9LACO|nr:haloacid dehalogenase-like hydrolase [Lapidilactobacillus achengensis]
MKRLISADTSELLKMNRFELKQSIAASEGRTLLSENVAGREAVVADITSTEIAHAFGADLVLLNGVDVFEPVISGLPEQGKANNIVEQLHRLAGCPIGVNLEPVGELSEMVENQTPIAAGRQLSQATLQQVTRQQFDFICLTGNPGTGVTNSTIARSIRLARDNFPGLIIAGKMHSSGVSEPLITADLARTFLAAGADIVLVPAVGTVPGVNQQMLTEIVTAVHAQGGLVMSAIGTSQEGSETDVIKRIALTNKICGVDIQHIGDAGFGGVAPVQNIIALSDAIRGSHHTISRIARSINR